MKKILLLVVFINLSCEIPYDGKTIINIKLKVINSDNEPLANEKSYIATSYADDSSDFSTYKKTSNEDGFIQFNMFKPTNSSSLILENSSKYLPVNINGLNDGNFEGLNWDLGTLTLLKLDEITGFTIIPNQISAEKMIFKIDIDAVKYEEQINLYNDDLIYNEPQLYHQLKKNQNFQLNYQIKNITTEEIEYFSIPLNINSDELNYTLTY
ncbi:hypothetical protein [uncultured Flavobacterium sp.]|jgi:hypothetical protein|uniref:hypothetical protein n=1 Tax=uncultured Flavobacterium sp. TaxID=165435 RepID=UPI0025949947|nr:hypothetical protein [uncultured Flavobacterium sp.]